MVAVLDTGLDSNHTAFSPDNFTSDNLALTYEDVAAVIKQTKAYELAGGLSAHDVYINEKVPFGYDYADNDPDPYSTHNNHGTHVSGVIVGSAWIGADGIYNFVQALIQLFQILRRKKPGTITAQSCGRF